MNSTSAANEMMEVHYSSTALQKRVENQLSNVRLNTYLKSSDPNARALESLESDIAKLSEQGPGHCRNEPSRIRIIYLRKAVVGYSWA
ncbi:hypothetical protein FGB62_9g413 [Gracilaria domingensis]|nr:hypothetical protein FGB62_9g413 [Gracilaria domingensis]